ncbi:thioredoxin [Gehongia tenuis]|uniref:Thioredoxin n=1 Tax=Gehongia tenuis TaxID=2763655 RepID=A0A926D4B2_9FIRM|nr:thioredoxin [Gehongia tenuis]MBC8531087.1 thioredoxin [Gehongia tenuis]
MAEINVTAKDFEEKVLNSELPVLVDFWAPWCGPCRMVAPILEQIAGEMEGKITVAKVNVDEEQSLAQNYRVMSIPTMIIFKGGKAEETAIGARPKADIVKMVEKYL